MERGRIEKKKAIWAPSVFPNVFLLDNVCSRGCLRISVGTLHHCCLWHKEANTLASKVKRVDFELFKLQCLCTCVRLSVSVHVWRCRHMSPALTSANQNVRLSQSSATSSQTAVSQGLLKLWLEQARKKFGGGSCDWLFNQADRWGGVLSGLQWEMLCSYIESDIL